MRVTPTSPVEPPATTAEFYVDVLRALDDAGIPNAVGGTYAISHYTGISRETKDLDVFLKPEDRDRALKVLEDAGFRTEHFYDFWISKAISGEAFVDIIYNSGNGLCVVDDDWFTGPEIDVLGYRSRLIPAEEQLWSKAFVMDRDRFDGGDVIHILLGRGQKMDWDRLLRRFAGHEGVLMAHILLFRYAYPGEWKSIPDAPMRELESRLRNEKPANAKLTRGGFIAQKTYTTAIREWNFTDGRIQPHGPLTREQVEMLPAT